MSITITNRQAWAARDGLKVLATASLNAKVAYRVFKLAQRIDAILEPVEKVRAQLVDKYVKRDEAGKQVPGENPGTVVLSDPDAFTKDMNDVLDATEAHILGDGYEPLTLDMLGDATLPPAAFAQLGPLFSDS